MRRNSRQRTAVLGEWLAARWLWLKGYRVLERNWRCAAGEVDLICRQGQTIVFVEVKTRRGKRLGAPEDAVDARKRRRLVQLARIYLARCRLDDAPCRFDVVAVVSDGVVPSLRHLKAAFRADSG
jgi:putative endonuclease